MIIMKYLKDAWLKIVSFINPKICKKEDRIKVIFPIGVKLIIIFALVLFSVLIIINSLMSARASRNLEIATAESNFSINSLLAAEAESRLNSVRKDVYLLLDFIRLAGPDTNLAHLASAAFFERSFFIAAVYIPAFTELINNEFFVSSDINPDTVSSWFLQQTGQLQKARQGEAVIANVTGDLGVPLLAMFYPWQLNNSEEAVVILFSLDGLAEVFGQGNNTSFITNSDGDLLYHTNYRKLLGSSQNVLNHPLFIAFSKTDVRDIRIIYTENRVKYFGAGKKIPFGDLLFFTSQEYDLPFKKTAAVFSRNIFLIFSAIFISVIFIWLVSKTISVPVYRLVEAVSRIQNGAFNVDLKYRFPDELGLLSRKFNDMGKALAKRELIPAAAEPFPVVEIKSLTITETDPASQKEKPPTVKTKSRSKKSRK